MGLLDEIRQDSARKYDRNGAIRRVLADLPPKDRTELEQALEPDSGMTHSAIARVLQARGYEDVTEGIIGTYRRKRR